MSKDYLAMREQLLLLAEEMLGYHDRMLELSKHLPSEERERARQTTERLMAAGIQLQEMAASLDEVDEIPADLPLRIGRALQDQAIALKELRALAREPDEGKDEASEWIN
jgi:hypothetical protein